MLLYVIGFVAGIVAGISPCVLPVLPVVLVAGATTPSRARTNTPEPETADASTDGEDARRVGPPAEPVLGATTQPGAVSNTGGRTPARVVRRASPARGGAAPTREAGGRARTGAPSADEASRGYRPYAVVAGLVLSFAAVTLAGSALLSALGLPQDLLRDAGLVVLGLVGAGLVVSPLGDVMERPFARLARHHPRGTTSGFVLGLGLGAVFVPCAGPVLTAITTVGATHRVSLRAVVLSVDFALGVSVPLLAYALAGQRMAARVSALRAHVPVVRAAGGVAIVVMTLLIAFNVTDGLQRDVPGYTSALQNAVEGGSYATRQLDALQNPGGASGSTASHLGSCAQGLAVLEDCGAAPGFAGISAWLNTPDGRPLTMAALRGTVVLVDFWTYSCINCQRSLPHVEAWYAAYHEHGFEVVGVHTPEFAFEHVVGNVRQADTRLGVHYPVAVDDGYKTWTAYGNNAWPAEYLVDAQGRVRHVAIGEGGYRTTESLIRRLLVQRDPTARLPPPTDVPDRTPTQPLTPESYLGYRYGLPNYAGTAITPDEPALYRFPATLPPDALGFAGTWTIGAEADTAGPDARIELDFHARYVYLVLGGHGTVGVAVDGRHTGTVTVSGIPDLYTMVHARAYETGTLVLHVSPGVQAYDFTFG